MAVSTSLLRPCLWFDNEAEEAAKFYTSIFPNSRIGHISYYSEAGGDIHKQPAGKTCTVEFYIRGVPFLGLNGGADDAMKFTPAISFQIDCKDQAEVDFYWERLLEGGGKEVQCGWLQDRFGVSWQVVPEKMKKWVGGDGVSEGQKEGCKRVTETMMGMKKLVMEELERAFEGK